jgi:putative two-component system response regulator
MLLIVDSDEHDRAILREMFRDRFGMLEACDVPSALEMLERHRASVALLFLNISLPGADGFEMLREMHARGFLPGIPVMMIASGISPERAGAAIRLGVSDFVEQPMNPEIVQRRAQRLVEFERERASVEELVEARTSDIRRANRYAIEALSTIVEFRSGETAQHTRRVSLVTRLFCQALSLHYMEYNLTDAMIDDIVCASALHDVGMIAVPESILNKPGRLTDEEFEIMKRHTIYGAQVIERISSIGGERFFSYCRDICLCHHERWDGNGYPGGLKGDAIPIWAQVVALADVYEALTSERVYKPPFTHEQALDMIGDGDCGAFSPKLLATLGLIKVRIRGALDELVTSGDQAPGDSPNEVAGQRALKLLEHEREQYKTYASLSGEVLLDYEFESDTLSFSGRFSDHFDGDTVLHHPLSDEALGHYVYPGDREALENAIRGASQGNPTIKIDLRLLTTRGWYEWYEGVVRTLWSSEGTGKCVRALGKLTNIDQAVRETCRLREQATRDVLTGLLNRVETERCIKQRLMESEDVGGALLYIDIDDFKEINDTRGHGYGDDVLRKMGQAIHGNIRESDIAGRIGGDEFIVYLDRVRSDEGIVGNVERLISVMRQGVSIRSERALISVSVGVARFPQDGARYEALLEKADQAMYTAKYSGKGCYAFYMPGQASKKS